MTAMIVTVAIAPDLLKNHMKRRKTMNDDGPKYIEAIAILNRHMNEGKVDTIDGLKAISVLLNRYNRFLKDWNEGRTYAEDAKFN